MVFFVTISMVAKNKKDYIMIYGSATNDILAMVSGTVIFRTEP